MGEKVETRCAAEEVDQHVRRRRRQTGALVVVGEGSITKQESRLVRWAAIGGSEPA